MIKSTPELVPSRFPHLFGFHPELPQHHMAQNAVLPQFLFVARLILAGNDSCELEIPPKNVLKSDFELGMLMEYFKEFSWGTQHFLEENANLGTNSSTALVTCDIDQSSSPSTPPVTRDRRIE
jgi:hypothetical protein